MANYQSVFERKETKYLITYDQWGQLMKELRPHMELDKYGKYLITNIYYDTQDWYLIRHSMSKPVYKEKVRLRSYGVPTEKDPVYIEIKKKFDGTVYKRRAKMRLNQAETFLAHQEKLAVVSDNQKIHEFESVLSFYPDLKPAMYLSYKRLAYFDKVDDSIRITFDQEILYRTEDLFLSSGSYGQPILPENHLLMEIKICGAMPVWLARILSRNKIFPAKFSKYANGYQNHLKTQEKTIMEVREREVYSA
ncbi:polyphosphate polymerase domain-containing protein [Carnobacterium pleistocenium]|uniref:polyphosphate polymerase domain-containing protein n=1 Tax=Carnobacterium pleistocenium TaxID=181073 RepID=UPI00054D53CB|nr:polyphosphate polymerase domain-containing protein [Carnobacterium pleistocenium]